MKQQAGSVEPRTVEAIDGVFTIDPSCGLDPNLVFDAVPKMGDILYGLCVMDLLALLKAL